MFAEYLSKTYRLLAPAKLNLRLKVEGRRPDGYHLLSMINVPVSLADEIEVELKKRASIELKVRGLVASEVEAELGDSTRNLATRALSRFFEHFSIELGAKMLLHKRIPSGAGLGGGSSDAGTVLRWIADLVKVPLLNSTGLSEIEYQKRVLDIAIDLGADVPFFLRPEVAWVKGIGEEMCPLRAELLAGWPILVVAPAVRVATPEVFSEYRERYPNIENNIDNAPMGLIRWLESLAPESVSQGDLAGQMGTRISSLICNDLEPLVREMYPELNQVFTDLELQGDRRSSLTGSGSSIFIWSNDLNFWSKHSIDLLQARMSKYQARVYPVRVLALGSAYSVVPE